MGAGGMTILNPPSSSDEVELNRHRFSDPIMYSSLQKWQDSQYGLF